MRVVVTDAAGFTVEALMRPLARLAYREVAGVEDTAGPTISVVGSFAARPRLPHAFQGGAEALFAVARAVRKVVRGGSDTDGAGIVVGRRRRTGRSPA